MTAHRTNHKAKLVMEWAWRHARRFQVLRGGPVLSHMSEALKLAWAELKADPTVAEFDKLRAAIRAAKLNPQPTPWMHRRPRGYVYGCSQR